MSDQPTTNLSLFPKGQFFITDKNGQKLKGRFSMYAIERFRDYKKITNYLALLDYVIFGMTVGDYADLILFALQDYNRKNVDEFQLDRADVMDLIDSQLDGISSKEFDSLIRHAIGRVGTIKESAVGNQELEEDKKKELKKDLTPSTSENDVTNQG